MIKEHKGRNDQQSRSIDIWEGREGNGEGTEEGREDVEGSRFLRTSLFEKRLDGAKDDGSYSTVQ